MKHPNCRAIGIALAAILAGSASATAAEPLAVSCLCKIGGVENTYAGRFAVDAESRDSLKRLIEANTFTLGKTITVRGNGCGNDKRLRGMDARCGDNSISRRDGSGKVTWTRAENTPFSGMVTLRVTSNSGIPLAANSSNDQPVVDEARWASGQVSVVGVMGTAEKVEPK